MKGSSIDIIPIDTTHKNINNIKYKIVYAIDKGHNRVFCGAEKV